MRQKYRNQAGIELDNVRAAGYAKGLHSALGRVVSNPYSGSMWYADRFTQWLAWAWSDGYSEGRKARTDDLRKVCDELRGEQGAIINLDDLR